MQLRDYQKQCVEAIITKARAGVFRQVIVLATGTGKTVIFSQLPALVKAKGKKTLILAHREELLEQAKLKLLAISPNLKVGIEQGANKIEEDVDVVIASVATIGRAGSKRIEKFNPDEFGLIIVDEVHHATASTYINVFRYFGVYKQEFPNTKGKVLLGVTATPNRSDHVGLDQIFDEITFNYSLIQGIQNGHLSNISAYTVHTDTDISSVSTSMGDFSDKELSEVINNDRRNKCIVDSYTDIAPHSKALVFTASVEHAKELSDYFTSAGYKSNYVLGETESQKRSDILKAFKDGELEVLTNVGVLTEGYDEPGIETILMTRPTKSSVLYSQMIGRGTRLHPGKNSLKLIDFVDNTGKHSICGLPNLFGVPKNLKGLKGRKITEVLKQVQDIQEVSPDYPVEKIEDWSDENIQKIIKKVDIFAQAQLPPEVKQYSKFSWEPDIDGYKLKFPESQGEKQIITIQKDMLDKYTVEVKNCVPVEPTYKNDYAKWQVHTREKLGTFESLQNALSKGDNWIETNKSHLQTMFDQKAVWRGAEPSEAQLKLLKKLGVPIHPKLTKGECSVLIGKALAGKKSKY